MAKKKEEDQGTAQGQSYMEAVQELQRETDGQVLQRALRDLKERAILSGRPINTAPLDELKRVVDLILKE